MCFGSTNPKVASGADNHDQSHRALSYDLNDEIYPNRFVQTNNERESDFWDNTRFAKDKEEKELAIAAPPRKKKAFTMASATYSTL
jgi:hypothetical protein